jgi:DNA-binding transcriptional ArsR family regulator
MTRRRTITATQGAASTEQPACAVGEHVCSPLRVVVDDIALDYAAAIFRALGDPSRLRLLTRLMAGPKCVTELAAELEDNLPAVSQRLKLLKSDRIVSFQRQGKHIYYRLDDDHIADLIRTALSHAAEPESWRSRPQPEFLMATQSNGGAESVTPKTSSVGPAKSKRPLS